MPADAFDPRSLTCERELAIHSREQFPHQANLQRLWKRPGSNRQYTGLTPRARQQVAHRERDRKVINDVYAGGQTERRSASPFAGAKRDKAVSESC
jgi:hypothetical protein